MSTTIPDTEDSLSEGLNRRDVLKTGLAGMMGVLPVLLLGSLPVHAGTFAAPKSDAYSIAFRNQHTGEYFSGAYRVGGKYLPESFERINNVLRDFRTGEVFPVDPRIIDIMYVSHRKTGANQPFEVLSGYRSPRTNDMLRRASEGVAQHSLHLTGQAVDVRLPGYSTRNLKSIAVKIRAGGVGYYPDSNFVHMDTGKVRQW
ncbi:MAG TPA: DUF882 domain-containing protein [Alphaproteobacteria bacterium]|jgi:uncharacterized protein YcbK (DUF882 family)